MKPLMLLGKTLPLLLLVILLGQIKATCPTKTVMYIDDEFGKTCKPCPSDCAICYLSPEHNTICAFCEDGFYLTENKKCRSCAENCGSCTGGQLSQCRYAKNGFYYNPSSQSIEQCRDTSCASCTAADVCSACKEGYYVANKTVGSNGMENVECEACGIDNCLYCAQKEDQIKSATYITCTLCKTGYGIVSGKCEKCPDFCAYCHEESKECTFCESGYYLNKSTNTCQKAPIENCYSLSEDGSCLFCESHFYLKDGACEPCKKAIEHCSYCTTKVDSLTCLSCEIGYYLYQGTECRACPANCHHCNSERCLSCSADYYFDITANECVKCSISNCDICKSATICEICLPGYYFDEESKTCSKCKGNCLKCFDDSDNCSSCPINFFTFQEEVMSEKTDANFLTSLLGLFIGFNPSLPKMKVTELKVITKCLKECPKTYKGKEVLVNLAERRCYVKRGGSPVSLPNVSDSKDVVSNLMALKVRYDEEIENQKRTSEDRKSEDKSGECFYNGKLKKEIRGNYDSYYICRCDENFMGDNCQITLDLYKSTQSKLSEHLDEIQKQFITSTSKTNKKKFLSALILVNKFRISRPVLERIIEIVRHFLEKDKELDNRKKLYVLYDAILLNLFDLLEDLKKNTFEIYNTETSIQIEKMEIYNQIQAVVDMLENSLEDHIYLNSFLERNTSHYTALDTYSFVIAEYKLGSIDKARGLTVQNPNIDTSFNVAESNRVYLNFVDTFNHTNSNHNVQILSISSPLFENKVREQGEVLVSNLLYLKYINPEKPHETVYNRDSKVNDLKIDFALTFMPAYDDVLANVNCKAYSFVADRNTLTGEAVTLDEDRMVITCKFQTNFEFKNYYFAISMRK